MRFVCSVPTEVSDAENWLRAVREAGFEWAHVPYAADGTLEMLKDCGFRVAWGFPSTPEGFEAGKSLSPGDVWASAPWHLNVFADARIRGLGYEALAKRAHLVDAVVVGNDLCNEISFPLRMHRDAPYCAPYHLIDPEDHDLRGPWEEWLARGYGTVERFNAIRRTSFGAFTDVPFPLREDDDYTYRSFIDHTIQEVLEHFIDHARHAAPDAEIWLAPCAEGILQRPPFPFVYRLDRLVRRWPDLALCVFGGNWFTKRVHQKLSPWASYIRDSAWRTVIGGANGAAGLTQYRSGERLLSMGMNGLVCAVSQEDDLSALSAELRRLAALPHPFFRPTTSGST